MTNPTNTIQQQIKSLMIDYAGYSKAVDKCCELEWGTPEYEQARESRDFYEKWVKRGLTEMAEMGIGIDLQI